MSSQFVHLEQLPQPWRAIYNQARKIVRSATHHHLNVWNRLQANVRQKIIKVPSCGLSSFRSPPVKRLSAWRYTSCYIPFQGGVLAARLIIVKPREHESANRPFPSSKTSTFKTRLIAKHFFVKMSFIFMRKKNHFHINGFTCSLALKQRLGETRKWLTTVAVINLVKIFSRLCQTIILLSGF